MGRGTHKDLFLSFFLLASTAQVPICQLPVVAETWKDREEVQDGEMSPEHAQHFRLKRSNLSFPMPIRRKASICGGDLEVPRNSEEFLE